MRLYLLFMSFSLSGVCTGTFRIFLLIPLPPSFTMLKTSYSLKNVVWYRCNNIVLEGKREQIQSLKNVRTRLSLCKLQSQLCLLRFVVARKYYPTTLFAIKLDNVAQQFRLSCLDYHVGDSHYDVINIR